VAPVIFVVAALFILGLIIAGILLRTIPPALTLTVAFPGSDFENGFCANK